jgi:serine/threonine-protein kinase
MAPEVEAGDASTTRSDVWSLGALLARVGEAAPTAPPALRAIVARATHTDPAARYVDAAALADDLRRFLDGERVLAHDEGRLDALARLARGHPLVSLLVVAAGIAVAVVAVVASVAVARARAQTDLARAAPLIDAAERALRGAGPDEALAARALADASLALLDATGDDGLRARAQGARAATARVEPMATPPAAPPALEEATNAALPLDGGRRVARVAPDGRRHLVRATMTLAMWTPRCRA